MTQPAAKNPPEAAFASDASGALTERVWRDFGDQLKRFIGARVRDPATTDDLLQETLLKVHRSIGSLRDEERVAPWVFRIARNVVVDHLRRERPTAELPGDLREPPSEDEPNHNEEVAGWLRPMISQLPAEYREALELAELSGVTQRELAHRLGLSVSGAKSRVQRGRSKLKKALGDCCALELDRRGNVIERRARSGCC